jgi:hypothetical protein
MPGRWGKYFCHIWKSGSTGGGISLLLMWGPREDTSPVLPQPNVTDAMWSMRPGP